MTPEQATERAREWLGPGFPQGCSDEDSLVKLLLSVQSEQDCAWRDALFPGNADTDLGRFCLEPEHAARVIKETESLVASEARQEERKRCEGIVGQIQPAFVRDEILRRLKEP